MKIQDEFFQSNDIVEYLQNVTTDFLITMDGTAGSGKSSLSSLFAAVSGFPRLNSGLLYRIYAYNEYENIRDNAIIFDEKGNILINGNPIDEKKYRTKEMDSIVSEYASKPKSREKITSLQYLFADTFEKCLIEGRDIGSVVFPGADVKFFVDASPEIRAERKNRTVEEILKRDEMDSAREISPLKRTSDMFIIDTTRDSLEESLFKTLVYCKKKIVEKMLYI